MVQRFTLWTLRKESPGSIPSMAKLGRTFFIVVLVCVLRVETPKGLGTLGVQGKPSFETRYLVCSSDIHKYLVATHSN